MAKPTYRQRAAAGATVLDEKYGRGWARKIKLRRLDQTVGGFDPNDGSACGCIAAQLDADRRNTYGSYSAEVSRLFGRGMSLKAVQYGFNIAPDEPFTTAYSGLTEAWKDEVRSRR